MPISRVDIAGKENTLFNKLETTTFEREYRAAYVDHQKQSFFGKYWAIFCLHTFCRNGRIWNGDRIAGVNTLKAERAAIKEYTPKRDTLITELAKTGIKFENWAALMGGTQEPLTSDTDPLNARLRQARHVQRTVLPAF